MHPPSHRRYPAPGVHLQSGASTCVILTVTTEHRSPWLANQIAQQNLEQTWREATAWLVTDYLLMPDHLHCFCFPGEPSKTIERWISYWKDQFRKSHQNAAWRFQSRGWHHRPATPNPTQKNGPTFNKTPSAKTSFPNPAPGPLKAASTPSPTAPSPVARGCRRASVRVS